MSDPLRSKIIRLAHANPELRPHLLPLLAKTARLEGKMSGNGWRLTWNDYLFKLEELPAKGKMKLRVSTLENPYYSTRFDAWLPDNVLNFYGKVSPSDSFDAVKAKILAAIFSDKAIADVRGHAKPGYDPRGDLSRVKWEEFLVHYTNVVPENVEPFVAKGKDFSVKAEWLKFQSYSPSSDFQQADPHYTIIKSSAPASARKLYQMLKANPNVLRGVAWSDFDKWLKANKINYKYEHSVWH